MHVNVRGTRGQKAQMMVQRTKVGNKGGIRGCSRVQVGSRRLKKLHEMLIEDMNLEENYE